MGQAVKGRVLKINPFGLFVELDPEIHGLAHISELAAKPVKDVNEVARVGDEFEFRIVSLDPENHRLGLSLKSQKKKLKSMSQTVRHVLLFVGALLLVGGILAFVNVGTPNNLNLSTFAQNIEDGKVKSVTVRGTEVEVVLSDDTKATVKKNPENRFPNS